MVKTSHVIRLQVLEVIIISSMRCGVSSPDETLKKRVENMTCRGGIFDELEVFHLVNTVLNA